MIVKVPSPRLSADLGDYQAVVDAALAEMADQDIMRRIWAKDHTVWKPDPAEISNRLGWLDIAARLEVEVERLNEFAAAVRADGLTDVLLLGMGGSSLAPELFAKTFGGDGLDLRVLDSTDADAVRVHADRLHPAKTLFIVATKSGGTVETLSFFKVFYNWTAAALGPEKAGGHFVAITDPGSKLEKMAADFGFRDTFLNDPNIGGRYSALSFFGLVPAALVGVDVATLLTRAQAIANEQTAWLGAALAELAKVGRDKLTLVTSPAIASFGDWVEQLIAESTGKEGKGILPVVGEPLAAPEMYGDDRLFVSLKLAGDVTHDPEFEQLAAAGLPTITIELADVYDLGGQFFLWEMATAVAGHRLGIQPFDQPNVEAAKVQARKMTAAFMATGALPEMETAVPTTDNLHQFLAAAQPGDYIAIHAYVPPTPESDAALQTLRVALRDRYKLATTVGYGPRFLHSTGQLHKGDGGNGLFIQLTSDPVADLPILDEVGKPDASMSFGVLKLAQALGDGAALRENCRRFIRFHLGQEVLKGLRQLTSQP